MPLRYDEHLKPYARELRKTMTLAERRLWRRISRNQLMGFRFYRQKPLGPYIVDFFCPAAKLVVELDGSQHYIEKGRTRDQERDRYLAGLGLRVLRFSDRDVLCRTDEVVQAVFNALCAHTGD